MMQFFRSLFGFGGSSGTRTVVGHHVPPVDIKDVGYLTASKARLDTLFHLYNRYKNTPHYPKIKSVHQKTKIIHEYLVARNRLHELELFHIQNTEHFINTFTVIMDAYESQHGIHPDPAKKGSKGRTILSSMRQESRRKAAYVEKPTEMIKPVGRQEISALRKEAGSEVPELSVPDVLINTYARIPYVEEGNVEGLPAGEIGFTSTEEEKEAFLQYVSARLGIKDLSYLGNALVHIPNSDGTYPTGLVPIIHWEGFLYALNLNDFRVFPVRIYRKSG